MIYCEGHAPWVESVCPPGADKHILFDTGICRCPDHVLFLTDLEDISQISPYARDCLLHLGHRFHNPTNDIRWGRGQRCTSSQEPSALHCACSACLHNTARYSSSSELPRRPSHPHCLAHQRAVFPWPTKRCMCVRAGRHGRLSNRHAVGH